MRRTWSFEGSAATTRVAGWGHYGRPVLWLGPGAPDHLQLDKYGLVDPLQPLLGDGRLKLYSSNVHPSDTAELLHRVVPAISADCGETEQAFGVLAADEAAAHALALVAAAPRRFDRVLLLEPWFASSPVASSPDLLVHVLSSGEASESPAQARHFRAGDVHRPGWARWRADLPALLHGWLEA